MQRSRPKWNCEKYQKPDLGVLRAGIVATNSKVPGLLSSAQNEARINYI